MSTLRLSLEEEKTLWNQFRAGQKAAFEKLMQANYRALFNYGTKFTKDSEFIKDCIQDLFLELWKNRSSLGETLFPKSYLLKSLRRKIYRELYKKLPFTKVEPLDEAYSFNVEFPVEHDIIREQVSKDTAKQLAVLLNQLPRRQKEVIYLKFYEELEVDEIAQVMDINHQSVYNHMHKALTKLREYWLNEKIWLLLFMLFAASLLM